MDMDLINTVIFTIGGQNVVLIDLLTAVFGLTTVFLAGRNSKYNFWVGYAYTLLLCLMFWSRNLWASMCLQPISLAINIIGHYRWTHPKAGEESSQDRTALRVSTLSWTQRALALAFVIGAGALLGWAMSKLHIWFEGLAQNPRPYLDGVLTVLILTAQYLSAQKKFECWIAWLFVNITNLALYLSIGLVFMPIVSTLYLINGIWSLWSWFRLYKKKA